jgi:hypothetical protein
MSFARTIGLMLLGGLAACERGKTRQFSRRGSRLVSGSWDGGNDADSTYVPAPGYAVDVTCAPAPLAPSTTGDTSKPRERLRR